MMMLNISMLVVVIILVNACTLNLSRTEVEWQPTATAQSTPIVQPIEPEQPSPDISDQATQQGPVLENGQPLAARVNGQPIFLESYEQQVSQFEQSLVKQGGDLSSEAGQARLSQIRQQVLETLIDQALIEQEAAQLGLTISETQLAAKAEESAGQGNERAQFDDWLTANGMTYDDFEETLHIQLVANRLFEQVTHTITDTVTQIQVRQILVADEATARDIIDQLKNGANFESLAETNSIDEQSRFVGGELGWFPQGAGVLPPEVEKIAFSLQPREVSGPIPTSLGFHIIQLEAKEEARPVTDELLDALKERTFTAWLAERRAASVIETFVEP